MIQVDSPVPSVIVPYGKSAKDADNDSHETESIINKSINSTKLHSLMVSSTATASSAHSLLNHTQKHAMLLAYDDNDDIIGASDNSNLTHNISSSPTSFKVSRSDTSEDTNDTSLSSMDERLNVGVSSTTIDQHEEMSAHTLEIDPLHIPAHHASPRAESTSAPLPSGDPAAVGQPRRHTAPYPLSASNINEPRPEIQASRHSLSTTRPSIPVSRSTFTTYRKVAPESSIGPKSDTTSMEIMRMRDSILVKRNLKKRRKEFLEDEKVLVGNKISEGHENFVMAYNMLTGIRVAVSRCSGVMMKLKDEDFTTTKKLSFKMDGSELTPSSKYDFKFKDYSPAVFRELRSSFGLDPADYLVSITGKYILSELGSPGKSGSFFYYSRDFRFIIKTIHHSEHKQLRKILKSYYTHVKENPNTLISQFYGLHRVKMPSKLGVKKVHFIVMNNLFPPHRDIHIKYDLKGSTWGRITKLTPEMEKDLSQTTLKDLNWLEGKNKIQFGPQKRKLFFDQLESDVKFLKKINVMDYSLLLGIHDVKKGNTSNLTQKLSVFDPKSSDKSELIKTNPRDIDRVNDLPSNVFPGRSKYVFYGHDGGIRATNEENEPIAQIYYMGIIDCLTVYGTKKKLETFFRSLNHQRSTISAVPAQEYGDRFLKFIKAGTSKLKSKFA